MVYLPYEGDLLLTKTLVDRVLSGERAAVAEFVSAVTPILRRSLGSYLLRQRGRAAGRDVRQEIDDLVQQVYLALFDHEGRALRAWRPDGGRSLEVFLARFGVFQASSILRTGKLSPWTESPTESQDLLELDALQALDPLAGLDERRLVSRLRQRLEAELSAADLQLFQALYVEDREVDAICQELGINEPALYQRKRRLRQRVLLMLEELQTAPPTAENAPPEVSGPRPSPRTHQ